MRAAAFGFALLGIGTMAAYGRTGDFFQFYEIDPDVERIARETKYFNYLAQSEAEVSVRIGDARLSLEAERRAQAPGFDVLVLDAFSSDSIPVHLLTTEAFEVYTASLVDDGILAVHVSNSNFHLAGLVQRLGSDRGLHGIHIVNNRKRSPTDAKAAWVLLSSDVQRIDSIESSARAQQAWSKSRPRVPEVFRIPKHESAEVDPWTDDYSDLFHFLL